MSGRLSPTLDNEMQFFPFDNWQEEFVTCNKLNIQNLVWVIDSPTIFTNPLLDYNKISNIISNSKKYNVNIIGVILHFFVQEDIFTMLKTESKILNSILEKVFRNSSEIGLDFVEIPFMGKTTLKIKDFESLHFNGIIENIANLSDKYLLKVFLENQLDYYNNLLLLEKIKSNSFLRKNINSLQKN